MVKTTLKQLGERFNSFLHGIRFVSEHLGLLDTELQQVQLN